MLEDRLDDVGVVVDTELIGNSQEQRVGLRDGFVLRELLDKGVRLGGIAAAENRSRVVAEETDLVLALAAAPKIGTVAVINERKDAAADRHPRLACVPCLFPRRAECPDLLGLLNVKR